MPTRDGWRRLLRALALLALVLVPAACTTATGPATETAAPEATPVPQAGLAFTSQDLRVDFGQCTWLDWQGQSVLKVYLDGRGVDTIGRREVCPTESTTYTLTAVAFDGSQIERSVSVEVVGPTPTATKVPAPTAPPASRAPLPTATPEPPTAAPTAEVMVDFYCNNRTCDIPKTDLCSAVIWETRGVSNVELEQAGKGRAPVGASGRHEICFQEESVTFTLYYKLPSGAEEKRELRIKRKG